MKDKRFCKIKNAISWRIDNDGILKCTAGVMRSTVITYNVFELMEIDSDIPELQRDKDVIFLYVPPEELSNRESLKSLEGSPITKDWHEWQIACSEVVTVGNVAGSPIYDETTGLVITDLVITDPETIQRIIVEDHDSRLVEISAGYRMIVEWTPGLSPEGVRYDGIQKDLLYNHVTLLEQGQGKAGRLVKIFNSKPKGVAKMDYVKMKIGNSYIRVMNEDSDNLQREMDDKDKKAENQVDGAQLDDAMTRLNELNEQNDSITKERDELTGQLQQVKDQLEQAMSPDTMSAAVDEAIQDQADADVVMDAFGADDEQVENSRDNGEKALNSKRVYGHELRLKVVNSIRAKNKKAALDDETAKNSDIVKGMFIALKDSAPNQVTSKKIVNGTKVMQVLNSKTEESSKGLLRNMNAAQRVTALYYGEKTKGGNA